MKSLNVYLADDHNIVAQGIATLLWQIEMVAEVSIFSNGRELLNACIQKVPDVVFLDLEMPVLDGKRTLAELQKRYPQLPTYILSMNNEKNMIEFCLSSGAAGYLNKDCSVIELQEALVTQERPFLSREVLKIMSGLSNKKPAASVVQNEPLSHREKEVLKLLCDGLSPKEIADVLFLSKRTVETHKNNVMSKLNVNSVGKLISVALKNNIV